MWGGLVFEFVLFFKKKYEKILGSIYKFIHIYVHT